MRGVDLMWAVPALPVIIVVAGAFGGSCWLAVALLLVLTTPFDTPAVRGATREHVPRRAARYCLPTPWRPWLPGR